MGAFLHKHSQPLSPPLFIVAVVFPEVEDMLPPLDPEVVVLDARNLGDHILNFLFGVKLLALKILNSLILHLPQ